MLRTYSSAADRVTLPALFIWQLPSRDGTWPGQRTGN
jgi:hypothetical protein